MDITTWKRPSKDRRVWSLHDLTFPLTWMALALYAFGILSIGLTRDWRLLHEDNGAVHTTLALSHLTRGLAKTRAHDLFFNPRTGEAAVYGHHPPALALILAGAFAFTGSDAPWVARMVAIVFHLGSLFLIVVLLSRLFTPGMALFGGFLMATLPMSAYFGRMVNYEPLCLFAALLQLVGYATFRSNGSRRGLVVACFGILFGGLVDWGAFFFAAAIAGVEGIDALRHQGRGLRALGVVAASAIGIFLFDLWHLWYAGHGSLQSFYAVLLHDRPARQFTLQAFTMRQLEIFRRYYTHTGLLASVVTCVCLLVPRMTLSNSLFTIPEAGLIKRLLAITGGAALGYVLAAPAWAKVHPYWQFYFLPFVVVSMLLVWQLLWRKIARTPAIRWRTFVAIFLLEVVITAVYTLHARHTKIGAYAIKQTATFRATYLAPTSFEFPGP